MGNLEKTQQVCCLCSVMSGAPLGRRAAGRAGGSLAPTPCVERRLRQAQLATLGLPEDGGDFSPPKGQVQGRPSMSAPGFGQSRQSEAGPDSGGPSAPLSGPSAKPPLHVQARDGRLASSVPPRLWCWPFLLCRRPWAACGSAPPSSLAGLRGATERKDRLSALQGV